MNNARDPGRHGQKTTSRLPHARAGFASIPKWSPTATSAFQRPRCTISIAELLSVMYWLPSIENGPHDGAAVGLGLGAAVVGRDVVGCAVVGAGVGDAVDVSAGVGAVVGAGVGADVGARVCEDDMVNPATSRLSVAM